MTAKRYTPLEAAAALRSAADWLASGSRKRIRGRRLKRSPGLVWDAPGRVTEDHCYPAGGPSGVCLLGAAGYALDDAEVDTSILIASLACGDQRVTAALDTAYVNFDDGCEGGGTQAELAVALEAVRRAASLLEAKIPANAPEPVAGALEHA